MANSKSSNAEPGAQSLMANSTCWRHVSFQSCAREVCPQPLRSSQEPNLQKRNDASSSLQLYQVPGYRWFHRIVCICLPMRRIACMPRYRIILCMPMRGWPLCISASQFGGLPCFHHSRYNVVCILLLVVILIAPPPGTGTRYPGKIIIFLLGT